MATILPVILSGGSGTRLWPLSRPDYPKQLLPLPGPDTMLQATARRLAAIDAPHEAPLVVANRAHRDLIVRQLAAIGIEATVIVEPTGRNTAPAVALAAHHAVATGHADAALLVMPADHTMSDPTRFAAAVTHALPLAAGGALVTFGIVPTEPHTGYGYIRANARGEGGPVEEFVEKPDEARAAAYLASGEYYWNAGIFLFTATTFLAELERFAPDIASATAASMEGRAAVDGTLAPDAAAFEAVRADSIDYAVMEQTDSAHVVPLDAGWSDVGSWSALAEGLPADAAGNVFAGDVVAHDTRDTAVFAQERTVAVAGIDNTIVVETADSVLVTTRTASQGVKQLVEQLRERDDPLARRHRRQVFGWGSIEPLTGTPDGAAALQLVRVDPGARCTLTASAGARLVGVAGALIAADPAPVSQVDAATLWRFDVAVQFEIRNVGSAGATLIVQGVDFAP